MRPRTQPVLAAPFVLAGAAFAVAACSLVVSTDGLADGVASAGAHHVADEAGSSGDDSATPATLADGASTNDSDATIDVPSAASCAEILKQNPSATTGEFTIHIGSEAKTVHCEMAQAGGGWTRAIDFDALRDGCPTNWRFDVEPGGCARTTDGVDSAAFESPLPSFHEVMLSATGRQRASTDAFHDDVIDRPYMEGVSVTTRIDGKRSHVFSFAVGLTDDPAVEPANHCPCDPGATPVPSFVGINFLCDTAVAAGYPDNIWHATEDLWDQDARGADCTKGATPGPRFPTVKLPVASVGPFEVRIMADQERANEDVALKRLVVFVR